ncbi:hypothetical protein M409DRAFT_56226 [Zasmidium cellare ATCC 36951]|uniref:Uncharacterized protein n=1 Tax=Zasmidium cellare ATCC 36951 TaxID=1080233 RepID=A0A6A6CCD4_ZASCE|nr:uncharacterized protein M409DRAFT_56226 [Zasmidium cellare ATCC 36951]KAF2164857.1 hypothetical protein M409DRAFT_56226 [Zasmidium cellare ATCC 36951]
MAAYLGRRAPEDGLHVAQPGLEVLQPGLETHMKTASSSTTWHDEKTGRVDDVKQWNDIEKSKRLFGLRISTICLLLALLGAIIAAILAGILASKTHCKAATTSSNAPTITTTITASGSPTGSAVVSECSSQAGQDWISPLSHLKYTRTCNTFLNSSLEDYQNLFTAYQSSLDTCVAMCDSYNYWTNSTNVTVAVWNWKGKTDQTPGICWCVHVEGDYTMSKIDGQDSALRVGTFDSDAIPS